MQYITIHKSFFRLWLGYLMAMYKFHIGTINFYRNRKKLIRLYKPIVYSYYQCCKKVITSRVFVALRSNLIECGWISDDKENQNRKIKTKKNVWGKRVTQKMTTRTNFSCFLFGGCSILKNKCIQTHFVSSLVFGHKHLFMGVVRGLPD